MDWSEHVSEGGGGYFNEGDVSTPSGKGGSKSAVRQQFLCPVTVRQVFEAPEEGLKIGNYTTAMVALAGVVLNVDISSTKVKFSLTDDTGTIDCIEWLESDEGAAKIKYDIHEKMYYHVYGSIKSLQAQRRIMVFKLAPMKSFNEFTAFMAEVISVNQYAEKINQIPVEPAPFENNFNSMKNSNYDNHKTAFNPIQRAVLEAIKAVEGQVGWSKKDPILRSKFSSKQIEDALDFLISEGHIYSTVDDEHYCST